MVTLSRQTLKWIRSEMNSEFSFLQIIGHARYTNADTNLITKLFPASVPGEVFWIFLWDGEKLIANVLLHPALNHLIYNNKLKPSTLISFKSYKPARTRDFDGEDQSVMVVTSICIVNESEIFNELLANQYRTRRTPGLIPPYNVQMYGIQNTHLSRKITPK